MIQERKVTLGESIIIWLGLIMIFMPKINIISVSGQTAGLRIDDIIIFFIMLFILRKCNLSKVTKIEFCFFLLLFLWLLSNMVNVLSYGRSNILYSLRYLEYFMFFYIGYLFSKKYDLHKLLIYIVAINGIVILLQLNGLVGGFASEGLTSNVSDRAIGLTGGPWEIAAILNFSFAIFSLDSTRCHSQKSILTFYVITLILILLTGSRIPLVAHVVLLLIYLYNATTNKALLIFYLGLSAAIVLGVFALFSDIVSKRSENVFSFENIKIFESTYNNVVVQPNFKEFPEFDTYDDADLSWLMRVSKWTYALRLWISSPVAWIIGVGPGTWGTALDGGLLRLITETGLVGLTAFFYFLKKSMALNFCLKAVFLSLIINMLMIDIYISYKSMAIIFLSIGYYYNLSRRNHSITEKA